MSSIRAQTSFAHIGLRANDAHIQQSRLSSKLKYTRDSGISGGSADIADGKNLIAMNQVTLGNYSSGRV